MQSILGLNVRQVVLQRVLEHCHCHTNSTACETCIRFELKFRVSSAGYDLKKKRTGNFIEDGFASI